MRLHRSNMIAALSVFVGAAGILAGCGGADGKTEGAAAGKPDTASKAEPLKISMLNIYYTTEPPSKDNPIFQELQKYVNAQFDITWAPSTAYDNKFAATMAGGELPQVLLSRDSKSTALVNAVRSGMFWEIGPYLKDYPNLSKLNPTAMNNLSIDGKIYALPRTRPLTRNGIVYRKDWLEAVGMKEPKTLDEMVKMIRAFANDDPDRNGKKDTYGISVAGGSLPSGLGTVVVWNGGPSQWGLKDGKPVPDFMTDEFMASIKLYRQLFEEKVINQDFPVVKASSDLFNQGKAGVYFGKIDDVATRFNELQKANPQAKLDVIDTVEGPKGRKIPADPGFNGIFTFPKTNIKSEAQLKQILAVYDKLMDEKIQNLFDWGIEGKHYKMDNGKPVRLDEKLYSNDYTPMMQLRIDDGSLAMKGTLSPEVEKYLGLFKKNDADANVMVSSSVGPLISQTDVEKGAQLAKGIGDAVTQYVMGKIGEPEVRAAIEQWRKNGGDKIIEEYAAEYAKTSGK
ncbi:extracellular solute-binding protein [Paenibacillus thalictri]|uniref:Extracellular solute-binding protein n=1 Tax=Paenibacillus thalictri TaxID=2527873 RepID=A0A4Q9DXG3_9BACL|nr:extracellular solute-binding protein [Paenibacillus thalictri]TBL80750.1 extracellular solute-binding protein [Paenibacillus thalictri]